MFDFKNNVINVPATIMKGRVGATKPIPAYFEEMVTGLHMWNKNVLEANEMDTAFLFLTTNGLPFENATTKRSNIAKRLNKYKKDMIYM